MRTGTNRTGRLTLLARVFAAIAAVSGVLTVSSTIPVVFAEPVWATFEYPGDRGADLEAPIEDEGAASPVAVTEPTQPTQLTGPGKQGIGVALPPRPKFPDIQVIGHRGAPAYRPQHTLEGYQLAISQGADWIEPDLVMTKDGRFIARHEADLTDSTDIKAHPEFADRAKDGRWHSDDLTLAEIKTLKATGGPSAYSGKYQVPTLEEVIALVRRQPRKVGVYIELKAPSYFRRIDLPMEEPLARILAANGWSTAAAPVYVQSLDAASLRRLHGLTGVRITQLLWGDASAPTITGDQLDDVARYASAIGVDRDRLRPYLTTLPPADRNVIQLARGRRLAVHVFTFSYRNPYGNSDFGRYRHPADPTSWSAVIPMYRAYYALGVSAVFTDTPNIAVYARG